MRGCWLVVEWWPALAGSACGRVSCWPRSTTGRGLRTSFGSWTIILDCGIIRPCERISSFWPQGSFSAPVIKKMNPGSVRGRPTTTRSGRLVMTALSFLANASQEPRVLKVLVENHVFHPISRAWMKNMCVRALITSVPHHMTFLLGFVFSPASTAQISQGSIQSTPCAVSLDTGAIVGISAGRDSRNRLGNRLGVPDRALIHPVAVDGACVRSGRRGCGTCRRRGPGP